MPMPLTAGLTDTCDYNQNLQIHVPSSIPVILGPGAGGWHSWNSCSAQQLQVWDSAAKARLRQ